MKLTETEINAIRSYWLNTLNDAERGTLEQRMKQEPDFREAADEQHLLMLAVESKADEELWAFIQAMHKDMEAEPSAAPAPGMSFRNVSVGIYLLVGFFILVIAWFPYMFLSHKPVPTPSQRQKAPDSLWLSPIIRTPTIHFPYKPDVTRVITPSRPKVYASLSQRYFRPSKFTHIRGGNSSDYQTALAYWDKQQYKRVYKTLQTRADNLPVEGLKLLAHAAFRLGRYEEAAKYFAGIEAMSMLEKEDARWNRLLCYGAMLPGKSAKFDQLVREIPMTPQERIIIKKFKK